MNKKRSSREILVVFDDPDEYLAKAIVSYLSPALEGFVVSCRNARWGCNPEMYLNVIQLNEATLEDSASSASQVVPVITTPYQQMLEEGTFIKRSPKRHANDQAKKVVEVITSRL